MKLVKGERNSMKPRTYNIFLNPYCSLTRNILEHKEFYKTIVVTTNNNLVSLVTAIPAVLHR